MIVIGVDVHKHSLTAVGVDEAGRMLDAKTVVAANGELLAWAGGLEEETVVGDRGLQAVDALARAAVARGW